jgi:hypothetical protein
MADSRTDDSRTDPPTPNAFDQENFTQRLIAETLFYDQEYGLIGNLSLIDVDERRERFIASFMPDDGTFLIEEATDWEDMPDLDEDIEVAYALAIDSDVYGEYEVPEVAAEALLSLAAEHDLLPSFTPLFEDEEL